jgi:hypothetical protein
LYIAALLYGADLEKTVSGRGDLGKPQWFLLNVLVAPDLLVTRSFNLLGLFSLGIALPVIGLLGHYSWFIFLVERNTIEMQLTYGLVALAGLGEQLS